MNAPAKTLDTNDEHVKYLYVSSTLDKADYAYNVDSDGNYVADSLDVTDKAEAHELVHVYERATVNSVECVQRRCSRGRYQADRRLCQDLVSHRHYGH